MHFKISEVKEKFERVGSLLKDLRIIQDELESDQSSLQIFTQAETLKVGLEDLFFITGICYLDFIFF